MRGKRLRVDEQNNLPFLLPEKSNKTQYRPYIFSIIAALGGRPFRVNSPTWNLSALVRNANFLIRCVVGEDLER